MATKAASPPILDRAARLAEVSACIDEVEVATAAQAEVIGLLTRAGYDTSEVLQALWVEMNGLAALRGVRRFLQG